MARTMADRCDARILTAQDDASPIPNVRIETAFSLDRPWRVTQVVDAVASDPPDWLVLQFNQFSYGRWGLNPFLPWTLDAVRRAVPDTKIAWMSHEDFVPAISVKFAIMRIWQRWQFQAIGKRADHIFFSIAPWVDTYGPWFDHAPVHHLPIGSNMPRVDADPQELRVRLGLGDAFVAGLFGTLRARQMGHLQAAMETLACNASPAVLLYVGPDGSRLQAALPSVQVLDAGRLPADDVSRHLAVMDLHLCPFIDGVSTRRGSFMAGLQHGVPTVATDGVLTDDLLRQDGGRSFRLVPTADVDGFVEAALALREDPVERQRMGRAARVLYDTTFDFAVTVPAFLDTLQMPVAHDS
jgi:glycosyltransferase involved in cell wall biosynthesis